MEKEKREDMIKYFSEKQKELAEQIKLHSDSDLEIKLTAGVDLVYWEQEGEEYAVCCIIVSDFNTGEIIEKKCLSDKITIPYIAGYLSFRELPLILATYNLLEQNPDIILFDGNGYLHPRHMGIATHASFYLNKPTIGIAKSYLKIGGIDYTMPGNEAGDYTDIVIDNTVYGRALRTQSNIKPIFVSVGNGIDLDTSVKIIMALINKESRQPYPIRLADIETKKYRREEATT